MMLRVGAIREVCRRELSAGPLSLEWRRRRGETTPSAFSGTDSISINVISNAAYPTSMLYSLSIGISFSDISIAIIYL